MCFFQLRPHSTVSRLKQRTAYCQANAQGKALFKRLRAVENRPSLRKAHRESSRRRKSAEIRTLAPSSSLAVLHIPAREWAAGARRVAGTPREIAWEASASIRQARGHALPSEVLSVRDPTLFTLAPPRETIKNCGLIGFGRSLMWLNKPISITSSSNKPSTREPHL